MPFWAFFGHVLVTAYTGWPYSESTMKRPRLTEQPEPMMLAKLRQIWIDHPDETSRTLMREIARLHGVLRTVDQASATVAAVWLAERGGRLSALHQLNLLLEREPAVMEQKERRGPRGASPMPSQMDDEDDDHAFVHIPLDGPG
jgi:hypothetical protein